MLSGDALYQKRPTSSLARTARMTSDSLTTQFQVTYPIAQKLISQANMSVTSLR